MERPPHTLVDRDAASSQSIALPSADTSLPRETAATVAVDARKLEALLRAIEPSSEALRWLEGALGRPRGALAQSPLYEAMGVDASRPILMGVARIDATSQSLMRRLYALTRLDRENGDVYTALRRIMGDPRASLHVRVVIPTTNAARLASSLEGVLRAIVEGREGEAIEGVDHWFASGDERPALSITRGDDAIAIDALWLVTTREDRASLERAFFAALRARRAGEALAPTLSVGDAIARCAYDPSQTAYALFVGKLATWRRQNPADATDIEGLPGVLSEASHVLSVSEDERARPAWARVEFALEGAPGSLRVQWRGAQGDAALERPSEALWAPARAVRVRDASHHGELSLDWLRRWSLPMQPAEPPEASTLRLGTDLPFVSEMSLGFPATWIVAAPYVPIAVGRRATELAFAPRHLFEPRFALVERVGIVWPSTAETTRHAIQTLLLRSTVSERVASCMIREGQQCRPRERLVVNGPVRSIEDERLSARLVRVDGRLVLLTSEERRMLETITPAQLSLTANDRAPIEWEFATAFASRELGPLRSLFAARYRLRSEHGADWVQWTIEPSER
jgi:hypothetical protein